MKITAWVFAAALIMVTLVGAKTVRANSVTFDASGTFVGGGTLGGTITINTVTGVVVAVDLTTTSSGLNGSPYTTLGPSFFYMVGPFLGIGISNSASNVIGLALDASTLVGYSGGTLCGGPPTECTFGVGSGVVTYEDASYPPVEPLIFLASGSLTPVAPTPEPNSAALTLLGLATLGLCMLMRRRNSQGHQLAS